METVVAAAEAAERVYGRGGRPKTQFARPSGQVRPITAASSMERVLHNDGYSIRLRGKVVDRDLVDLMMAEIHRLLFKR